MHLFQAKLKQAFPILNKSYITSRKGIIKEFYYLKNKRKSEWDDIVVPYIDETVAYLKKVKNGIKNPILIVCENEMIALKSVSYIKAHYEEYLEDSNLFDEYGELEFDDIFEIKESKSKHEEMIRVVNLQRGRNIEKTILNPYICLLDEVLDSDVVCFTGLTGNNDINEKLEVIGACPAFLKCICITPKQLMLPWVQELRMNFHYEILKLSSLDDAYYENVLQYLLEDEKYKFSKELSEKRLLSVMKKHRGKKFREEDIAWYLDEALEHMKKSNSKNYILKECHFPNLFVNEKKPIEVLNEMVGLENVKKIAREVAAITKEKMQNDKLGMLHKHMIFFGNPGTGKTTIAKILADIMAEEGNCNSNFVVADRKSLIGRYVGHTAPMVAQKFEEARDGILFVDEAGFFLNMEAGAFIVEAMKEFIRYMELYPDVTVIFAMYSDEVKEFLELDAGLSSRISQFVKFEDYSLEELTEITVKMLMEKGYAVMEDAKMEICEILKKIKMDKKKKFGNAREARNLAESMIIALSIRQYSVKKRNAIITVEDVIEGYERIHADIDNKQSIFGFYQNRETEVKTCCLHS